jgi:hypothetical protein
LYLIIPGMLKYPQELFSPWLVHPLNNNVLFSC